MLWIAACGPAPSRGTREPSVHIDFGFVFRRGRRVSPLALSASGGLRTAGIPNITAFSYSSRAAASSPIGRRRGRSMRSATLVEGVILWRCSFCIDVDINLSLIVACFFILFLFLFVVVSTYLDFILFFVFVLVVFPPFSSVSCSANDCIVK